MRMAGAPHHTNPRSATLDFWRKTTPYEQYKIIQGRVPLATDRLGLGLGPV